MHDLCFINAFHANIRKHGTSIKLHEIILQYYYTLHKI